MEKLVPGRDNDNGISICCFNHIHIPLLRRDDLARNHQKIVVIDGCRSNTGGMNIADRYSDGIGGRPWVDMSIRIDGPASLAMRAIFAEDWLFASGEHIPEVACRTYGCHVQGCSQRR